MNNNFDKNNYNINNIYTNTKKLNFDENHYNFLLKENEELKNQLKELQISYNKLTTKKQKSNNNNNNNNTSNSFILPSEFEKLWEEFSNILLEPFEYFISNNNNNNNNYIFLANLIQDLTLIVYNETQNLIYSKINDIKKLLNITSNQNEEILLFFKPFFREHYKEIFILKENFIITIINNLNNIIQQYKNINFNKEEFIKSTKDKNLKNVIKNLFNICLYLLLQNQIYSFNIKNFNERENSFYYYKNNNFICIDGFIEKKNSICIVLVPSPMKRKIIKIDKILPIVCLIKEPDENIIKKCEENKKILEEKNERKKNFFNDDENDNENDKIIHISQSNVQSNKINVYLKKNNTFTGNFNIDDNFNNKNQNLNENNNKNKEKFSFNGIKNRNKENIKLDFFQEGSITPTVRKVNNNQYMNFQTFTELSSNESRHNRNMTSNNFNDKSKNNNFSFYANVAMKNNLNDNKNYYKNNNNIVHTPNNKNNSIYNNKNKLLNSNFYNYSNNNNNNNVKYSYYKNNNQSTQINLVKKPNKNFNENNNNNNFSFTYNQISPKKNENKIYLSNEKKILNDLNININNYNNENTFRNQNKNNNIRNNNKYLLNNNNNNNNIININNSNFYINNINKYNKKNEENQSKNIINNIREQLNQMNNQLKQNFYFNNINNNNYNVNRKNYFNNNNNKQNINYTHQNN